jgi:hypothetical protein
MNIESLQGRSLTRAIDEVRSLLTQGEVLSTALCSLESLNGTRLWVVRGEMLTATPTMITLGDRLPHASELVPAVFSLLPEIRTAWLRVVRARLAEMGDRKDLAALTETIHGAGVLATELLKVAAPSLSSTSFGELERAILPAAGHEAAAFPVLLRVLAATAVMPDDGPGALLPELVFDDPGTAWRRGRLLRLPVATDPAPAQAVLSGALEGRTADGDALRWALHHPWAFLLAQLVFTKEAWEAERVSGGVSYEIEPAHMALLQTPPRVEVVVTLPSSEEVRCGSLGELVQRTLAQLGVTLLAHRITSESLDDRLGLVIDALLRRDVWRFEHGSGGRRPGYSIHPSFSDACYRALGSRAFYRLGSHITAAIRRAAETWARERIARASAGVSPQEAT